MQFFIPFRESLDKGSRWVFNSRAIAHNYLRGSFALFLLAALPIDLVLVLSDAAGGTGVLRILRLTKPIFTFLSGMNSPLRRWLTRLKIDLSLLELIKFVVVTLLTAHWFACLWGFIGNNLSDNQPIDMDNWSGRALRVPLHLASMRGSETQHHAFTDAGSAHRLAVQVRGGLPRADLDSEAPADGRLASRAVWYRAVSCLLRLQPFTRGCGGSTRAYGGEHACLGPAPERAMQRRSSAVSSFTSAMAGM